MTHKTHTQPPPRMYSSLLNENEIEQMVVGVDQNYFFQRVDWSSDLETRSTPFIYSETQPTEPFPVLTRNKNLLNSPTTPINNVDERVVEKRKSYVLIYRG